MMPRGRRSWLARKRARKVLDTLLDPERPIQERVKAARNTWPEHKFSEVGEMTDAEAEAAIGPEALKLKRVDPATYEAMLASLPEDDRERISRAVAQEERGE
jgi:hypothetical protein